MRAPLTIGELKIALCIIDKTWGFNKATDMISVGQIAMATNLSDRGVRKTIVALKEKRIIHYAVSKTRVNSGSPLNEFLFNKHYDTWRSEGCTVVQGVNKSATKGEQEGSLRVNSGSSTKETLTKETLTKETSTSEKNKSEENTPPTPPRKTISEDSIEFRLAVFFYKEILKNRPNHKKPNLQNWAKTLGLMINRDNRTAKEAAELIRWCQEDNIPDANAFCWSINMLCPKTLREKFDMLSMKKEAKEAKVKKKSGFETPNESRPYHQPIDLNFED